MRILATSGGFLPSDTGPFQWRRGPLIEHAIHLAGDPSGRGSATSARPPATRSTARSGSTAPSPARTCAPSHLELFTMPNVPDVRAHLLAQDVIWVGGGSVANLLAVWRVHGLDEVLRECWESGVVLGGVSAGSICWYVGGPTDSYGTDLQALPARPGPAALRQRRPLRQRGAAPAAAARAGRQRHAAHLARHRRRRRPGLRGHRAGRGGRRPARRRGVRRRAAARRHRHRDPDRAAAAA